MKKLVIGFLMVFYFLPCNASSPEAYDEGDSTLQEWCAKEEDPVKRLHYCSLLEKKATASITNNYLDARIATV